jgi:hypothetical protein
VAIGDGSLLVPLELAPPVPPVAVGGILLFSALVITLALRRRRLQLPTSNSQLPT